MPAAERLGLSWALLQTEVTDLTGAINSAARKGFCTAASAPTFFAISRKLTPLSVGAPETAMIRTDGCAARISRIVSIPLAIRHDDVRDNDLRALRQAKRKFMVAVARRDHGVAHCPGNALDHGTHGGFIIDNKDECHSAPLSSRSIELGQTETHDALRCLCLQGWVGRSRRWEALRRCSRRGRPGRSCER